MKPDRWTLLLIKDESSVRQYTLSPRHVRWGRRAGAAAAVMVVAAVAALAGVGAIRLDLARVTSENESLTLELERIRAEVAGLEGSIELLARRDANVRSLAGLEAIDGDVLEVGVGGPGLATPESHPLFETDPDVAETVFSVSYDLEALQRRAALLSASMSEALDSLRAHQALLEATPSILPTAGWISSRFSSQRFHPVHNRPLPHEGIDIAAPTGTRIHASANGRVTKAGWVAGYGQVVEVDHGFGFVTFYGHASRILVRVGQRVERGETIAEVGRTGVATSSHLHYEVRINGRPQNPINYVLPEVIP